MVTESMAEAEYIPASEAVKEALWIMNFMMDLGVVQGASNLLEVYCATEHSHADQEIEATPFDQAYPKIVLPHLTVDTCQTFL